MSAMTEKPPYRVPSMDEIRALEPNGIKVISTFSGCGGSSLGYRMAGCTVLGASEFVPAAYEVYRLNASPETVIWTDDIREMNGVDMLRDVGLAVGELDILDGSPPCAAFSTAGKRSEGWGHVKKYSDTSQRVDDLFYEYARVLKEMQPRAFVAENVEGLVKGSAKGYFKRIYAALEECGYNVRASVLDASWLGVPQARKRLIFLGIRKDLGLIPEHPRPLPYRYTLGDALDRLPVIAARRTFGGSPLHAGDPMKTITTQPDEWWILDDQDRDPETSAWLTQNWGDVTSEKIMSAIEESRRAAFVKDWGNSELVEHSLCAPSPTVMASGMGRASMNQVGLIRNNNLPIDDPETGLDLLTISPTLIAAHSDRYLRKFTLGELRRICSFPDDFQLAGTYQQRWERLGRSVPPVMMSHIARSVVSTLCAD
jgi:DNA (cytosine-5)-methyltransferase 1